MAALNAFKVAKQPFQSGLNAMEKPRYFTTGKKTHNLYFLLLNPQFIFYNRGVLIGSLFHICFICELMWERKEHRSLVMGAKS